MSKSHSEHRGFTLIEATLAIAVLLIGLIAVLKFFPFGLQIIGNSYDITTATNIALSQMENMTSTKYDSIAVGTIETKHRVSNDSSSYLYSYQRQTISQLVDVNLNPSATDIGFKKITVTVYWHSPIGQVERSTQIQSIIANH